jgi:hypothetical protein
MEGSQRRSHTINLWAGKIIPLIILAGLAYSIYIVTYVIASTTLAVQYKFHVS